MSADLISLPAREAVSALRAGEVSPRELVEASLRRIEERDGPLNALPTVCAERALERAATVDGQLALAGLPIGVKDLNDVAGVRTTHGSPIYADHVPDRSDIMVERLEERGAVVVAKSNTPEFGAGINTFNEVFGPTRNPWDTSRTCGGSSGGSAVALATRQVWLATGSDLGGSLRTPASFCSVVGLRPSPGRVARGPVERPFDTLSVEGPMARDVADCALMLDAMAGPHPEDPLALPEPDGSFLEAARAPRLPAGSPGATTSESPRSSARSLRSAGPPSSGWRRPAWRWPRPIPASAPPPTCSMSCARPATSLTSARSTRATASV